MQLIAGPEDFVPQLILRSWREGSLPALGAGWISGWEVLAVVLAVGAIAVEFAARGRAARRQARKAEVRLGLLSQTGAVLGHSLDVDKALSEVVQLAAASFQGLCLIHVPATGNQPEQLVAAHPDVAVDARLRSLAPPLGPSLGASMASPAPGDGRGVIAASSDEF